MFDCAVVSVSAQNQNMKQLNATFNVNHGLNLNSIKAYQFDINNPLQFATLREKSTNEFIPTPRIEWQQSKTTKNYNLLIKLRKTMNIYTSNET